MEGLQLRVSEVAYHLERLSDSKVAWKAVEKKDEGAFRKTCKRLRIPKRCVDTLLKIVFSSDPEPKVWPWD